MKTTNRLGVLVGGVVLLCASGVWAQDWPQWRGPNRDAHVTGFTAPKTWPKELTKKWKVTVGDGVATPALVGDKLYVFSRQDNNEIIRCLDAASGKELWQDKYPASAPTGPDRSYPGPRCSPAVAEGKVVTFGVQGMLSCLDAGSGKVVWRKETTGTPNFHTSSSPIISDGLCIAQVGGRNNGAIVAFDLATGNEKWKSPDNTPAYASPSLLSLGGTKAVVAETANSIVAVDATDGKVLWKTPFSTRYNASTPVVNGETIIYSGPGTTKAVKLEKKDAQVMAQDLWSISDIGVMYNTPVVKNGLIFGLTDGNKLFCLTRDGKTAWTAPAAEGAGGGGGGGGKGRMGGGGGYGSIVDAGSVLFALTPRAELIVYEPSDKEFKKLAGYKVAEGGTYAYPIVAGNRIFIKDRDSVTLWTID